jgi:hypothetical protein
MNTVRPCNRFPWFAVSFLLGTLAAGVVWPAAAQQAVTTFHGDNGRTGWNQAETVLTPASVSGGGFGQLATIPLDAQVNAQPLVVPGVVIAGDPNAGQHDVVYVATVGNTVYAIDPTAATVLLSRNLGAPPPPGPDCGSPRPGAGILGTPVIDPGQQLMYLIAYTQEAAGPTYRLHALALATLADAMPPVVVAATQTLSNGAAYLFNAAVERQRPALLLANGAVYAGFGAFCDANASRARLGHGLVRQLAAAAQSERIGRRSRRAHQPARIVPEKHVPGLGMDVRQWPRGGCGGRLFQHRQFRQDRHHL